MSQDYNTPNDPNSANQYRRTSSSYRNYADENARRSRAAADPSRQHVAYPSANTRSSRAAGTSSYTANDAGNTARTANPSPRTRSANQSTSARTRGANQNASSARAASSARTQGAQQAAASRRSAQSPYNENLMHGYGVTNRDRYTPPRTRKLRLVARVLAAVLLILVLGSIVGFLVSGGCSSKTTTSQDATLSADSVADQEAVEVITYDVDPLDIQALSVDTGISTFDLADSSASFSLSETTQAAIEAALTTYNTNGTAVGFLLLDCESGRGVSYNIDETVYGASTFKGPYSAFVLENFVETGTYELTDYIDTLAQSESGHYYTSGTSSLENVIYNTIIYSSNIDFGALREDFNGSTFNAWLEGYGIDSSTASDTWFLFVTARTMATLWCDIYNYVESETETAAWFKELLGSTETSFIRDALADVGGVTVYDKAGWYNDGGGEYDSVSDCAIVEIDGRDYLLCIMTSSAWSDYGIGNYTELASAVFAAHEELAR